MFAPVTLSVGVGEQPALTFGTATPEKVTL